MEWISRKKLIFLTFSFVTISSLCVGFSIFRINNLYDERRSNFEKFPTFLINSFVDVITFNVQNVETLATMSKITPSQYGIDDPHKKFFETLAEQMYLSTPGALSYALDSIILGDQREDYENKTGEIWKERFGIENKTFPIKKITEDGRIIPEEELDSYIVVSLRIPLWTKEQINLVNLGHNNVPNIPKLIEDVKKTGKTLLSGRNIVISDKNDWSLVATCQGHHGKFPIAVFGVTEAMKFAYKDWKEKGLEVYLYDNLDSGEKQHIQAIKLLGNGVSESKKEKPFNELTGDLVFYHNEALYGRNWTFVIIGNEEFQPPDFFVALLPLFFIFIILTFSLAFFIYKKKNEYFYTKMIKQKEKETFIKIIGYMCHEIRNPVQAILFLLKDAKIEDEAINEQLIKSTYQLSILLNDFVDFSKSKVSDLVINLSNTNVSDVIRDITHIYKSVCRYNENLRFNIIIPRELYNKNYHLDPIRLRQVLSNCVNNSCKYTQQGSIEIEMCENSGFLYLFVRDTGSGIQESDPNILFSEFRQGKNKKHNETLPSAGLGLSLCKKLTEKMGGRISIKNRTDTTGCEIEIKFIINEVAVINLNPENKRKEPKDPKKTTIFVCEDDYIINKSLTKYIKDTFSEQSKVFFDGETLLEELEKTKPDIILSDIVMKGIPGEDLIKLVKERDDTIKCIAMTGNVGEEDTKRYNDLGFQEIIKKPFDLDEIKKAI